MNCNTIELKGVGDRRLVDECFYAVTKKQGHFAEEALALGGSRDLNGIKTKEVIMHVMKVVF